jgi:hypothetical protein
MVEMLNDSVFPNLESFGIKEEVSYDLAFDHNKKEFVLYKNNPDIEPYFNMGLEDDKAYLNAPEPLRYKLLKPLEDFTAEEIERITDYVGVPSGHKFYLCDVWLQGEFVELIEK